MMKGRYLKDITYFSLAEAFAGIVYFCYILISARLLGIINFGLFQAVMGLYGILFLFGHPLKVATIHAVATSEDQIQRFVLGSFLKIALLIGSAYFILLGVSSPLLVKIFHADSIWPIFNLAFLLLVSTLLTTFYGGLQGKNLYLNFSITKVVGSLIVILLGVALMKMRFGSSGAIAGYAGSMALLTAFFFSRRELFSFRKGPYSIRRDMVPLAKPLAVMGAQLFVLNFPAVVARIRLTEDMAGLFGTLFSLRNLVLPFALAVVLPLYSRTISKQSEPRMLRKAIILILLLGAVFIVVGLLFPTWFLRTFYGGDFAQASRYMTLYGFALLVHMISMVLLFHNAAKETFSFSLLLIPIALTASLIIIPDLSIWKIIIFHILSWGVYLGCLMGHDLLLVPRALKTTQPLRGRHGRRHSKTYTE